MKTLKNLGFALFAVTAFFVVSIGFCYGLFNLLDYLYSTYGTTGVVGLGFGIIFIWMFFGLFSILQENDEYDSEAQKDKINRRAFMKERLIPTSPSPLDNVLDSLSQRYDENSNSPD